MGYTFVNPYNFIPLGDEGPSRTGMCCTGNLSGVIEYSLITKSPLFIPNTSNDDIFDCYMKDPKDDKKNVKTVNDSKGEKQHHKSYEFFSYDDLSGEKGSKEGKRPNNPIIPGSEMRGLIRSNYEILTNSCLSFLESDTVMQKRVAEVFKAGLLKKNGNQYDLYEAEDCLLRTISSNNLKDDNWQLNSKHFAIKSYVQKDLREGQKIKFEYVKRPIENNGRKSFAKPLAKNVNGIGASSVGYIIKGSDGPDMTNNGKNPVPKGQKHCCHVFCLKDENKPKHKNVNIDYLTAVIKAYGTRYSEYEKCLKMFMEMGNDDYFPVYYSAIISGEDKNVFLSPASITKELYKRKLSDLVGSHKTCSDAKNLCPACRLFGMLKDGKGSFAVASRVRFSDMETEVDINESSWESILTLEALSSPRLNNMEFYLSKPAEDAVFWTYDYYIDKKGNLFKNNSTINGRKFYWHELNKQYKNAEKSVLNATVRPLKAGVRFKGKVYFKNLSEEELDMLVYTLNAGADEEKIEEKKHGYKLGHAKSLGFGSVAIKVSKVELNSYKLDEVNKSVINEIRVLNEYEVPSIDSKTLENYRKMTDFNALEGKHTDYPRLEANGNIFDWFTKNHRAYDHRNERKIEMPNKRVQMYYATYLKPMEPETVTTVVFEDLGVGNQYNRNNKGQNRNKSNNNNNRINNGNQKYQTNKGKKSSFKANTKH